MMAETMARCLPNAELLTLEGANHGGPMRNADAFQAALLNFLDKVA